MNKNEPTTEYSRWGLPLDEIEQLGQRLVLFFGRFGPFFRNTTHDASEYGFHYLSGLLRMKTKWNMAESGRKTGVPAQNMQHFMNNSPWSGQALIAGIQDKVKQQPEFQAGAILALDESADEKAGEQSAGASRQHNGRLDKVEMSQVGVFLSLVTPRTNTWLDGELYLAERWFTEALLSGVKK